MWQIECVKCRDHLSFYYSQRQFWRRLSPSFLLVCNTETFCGRNSCWMCCASLSSLCATSPSIAIYECQWCASCVSFSWPAASVRSSRALVWGRRERCTKYFLSLEKRNAIRNSIQSLKVDGKIVTEKEEINQYFSDNLQAKYRRDSGTTDTNTYLRNNVVRSLSQEQRNALEKPLTLHELHVALSSMKKGSHRERTDSQAIFFQTFLEAFRHIFIPRNKWRSSTTTNSEFAPRKCCDAYSKARKTLRLVERMAADFFT